MELQPYLANADKIYDPNCKMLGSVTHSPGYHTRIPDGQWAHQTRQALDYALALLESGEPDHIARSVEVIDHMVSLQDTDPTNGTYGIWSWYYEEPLDKMAPPDWNWADFCGARLIQILFRHEAKLPASTVSGIKSSIGHAAWSIFRRNVGPGYSNIAVMGGGVALAVGEILGEPRLVDYARGRLQNIVSHHKRHGDFNEYNSPNYTLVVLDEAERFLEVVSDETGRQALEAIRKAAWQAIADHFHPPTQQWSGPHSRFYSDRLSVSGAAFLSERLGFQIKPHVPPGADTTVTDVALGKYLPCPPELRERFLRLPEPEYTIRKRFILADSEADSTYGTTWFSDAATLGSVNKGGFWNQHRPLIGYWSAPDEPTVVLRLRFLHDGRDFASVGIRTAQDGARALSIVGLQKGFGDFHVSLDLPPGGAFHATDFRLRYELTGVGATAADLGDGIYALSCGDRKAVVTVLPSQFDGHAVRWEIGEDDGRAYLDGICYAGPRKGFHLDDVADTYLPIATEIASSSAPLTTVKPTVAIADGIVSAAWSVGNGLNVAAPVKP